MSIARPVRDSERYGGMMLDEAVTSYTEALGPIRERVGTVLKIRYEDFDDLCGFAAGLSGKVFGRSQVRRFGIEKFFDAIRGVGLRIRFEDDPEQTARMLARIAENYTPREANQARPNNHAHLSNKTIDLVLNYLATAGRKGGLTRLNDAVKMARSNSARHASCARWQKRKAKIIDLSGYLENVSRLANEPALPELEGQGPSPQKPCSVTADVTPVNGIVAFNS